MSDFDSLIRECCRNIEEISHQEPCWDNRDVSYKPYLPVICVLFGSNSKGCRPDVLKKTILSVWEGLGDELQVICIREDIRGTYHTDELLNALQIAENRILATEKLYFTTGDMRVFLFVDGDDERAGQYMDSIKAIARRTQNILMLMGAEEKANLLRKAAELQRDNYIQGCVVLSGCKKHDAGIEKDQELMRAFSDIIVLSSTYDNEKDNVHEITAEIQGQLIDRNNMTTVCYIREKKPVEEIVLAVLDRLLESVVTDLDRTCFLHLKKLLLKGISEMDEMFEEDIENKLPDTSAMKITDFPYLNYSEVRHREDLFRNMCRGLDVNDVLLKHLHDSTLGVWDTFVWKEYEAVSKKYIQEHRPEIEGKIRSILCNNLICYLMDAKYRTIMRKYVMHHRPNVQKRRIYTFSDFVSQYGLKKSKMIFYEGIKKIYCEVSEEIVCELAKSREEYLSLREINKELKEQIRNYQFRNVGGSIEYRRNQSVLDYYAERVQHAPLSEEEKMKISMPVVLKKDYYGILKDVFAVYIKRNSDIYGIPFEEELLKRIDYEKSKGLKNPFFMVFSLASASQYGYGMMRGIDISSETKYCIASGNADYLKQAVIEMGKVFFTNERKEIKRLIIYSFPYWGYL